MPELIRISGQQLEAEHQRTAPGRPTLVFLHEGLGSLAQWRDFPARLAAATACNYLVYSRLGYGGSDPAPLPRPVTYLEDEAIAILPQLLAHFDIEQHILIGHSDGGSIALVYAGHHQPTALLGLITEAAHVFNEPLSVQSIQAAREAYLSADLRPRLAKYHKHVDNTFWGWNDVWLHPDFRQWNLENYLPAIQVPLLVIQGADDQYGTARQVEAIAAGVSGSVQTSIIPDCRHTPHKEQTEQTMALMTAFIQAIVPSLRLGRAR